MRAVIAGADPRRRAALREELARHDYEILLADDAAATLAGRRAGGRRAGGGSRPDRRLERATLASGNPRDDVALVVVRGILPASDAQEAA